MFFGLLILIVAFSASCAEETDEHPAIRVQANQKAVDYMKKVGLEVVTKMLDKKLKTFKAPIVKGSVPMVQYSVKNIHVTSLVIPIEKAKIDLTDPNGIDATVELSLGIAMDYMVKVNMGIVEPTQYGKVTGKATASATVGSSLVSADGKGKVEIRSCQLNVKHLDIDFHGNFINSILNLLDGIFEKLIKDNLNGLLCQQLHKAIDDDVNKQLAALPMSFAIEQPGSMLDNFAIDYHLVGDPVVKGDMASFASRARITYKGHENDPDLPKPGETPAILESDKMICLNMEAQAILESIGYAIQVSGKTKFFIDEEFLISKGVNVGPLFQCGCTEGPCLAFMLPQIRSKCTAGGKVQLNISLAEAPKIEVSSYGLSVDVTTKLDFSGKQSDGSVQPLFTLEAKAGAGIDSDLKIDDWKVKGTVKITNAEMVVKESQVGELDPQAFELLWQFGLKVVAQRVLEHLFKHGIPLPPTQQYLKIMEPEIGFGDHTMSVCFDAEYTGPMEFRK